MTTLTRKGYARIYTARPEDVTEVLEVIKELDEFEYSYLPMGRTKDEFGLVAPFSEFPKLVYTHKFDGLCMNRLTAECWRRGIFIWVCDNGHAEYMTETAQQIISPR